MDSKKIILYFEDIPISSLSIVDNKYFHEFDYDNLKKALEKGCPTFIIGSKEGMFDELPPIFFEFDISPGRSELREKLGINRGDTKFDVLYKIASNCDKFSKESFWISIK